MGRRRVRAMRRALREKKKKFKLTEEFSAVFAKEMIPPLLEKCVKTAVAQSIRPLTRFSTLMSGQYMLVSLYHIPKRTITVDNLKCLACQTKSRISRYMPFTHSYTTERAVCSCAYIRTCEAWKIRAFDPLTCESFYTTLSSFDLRTLLLETVELSQIPLNAHLQQFVCSTSKKQEVIREQEQKLLALTGNSDNDSNSNGEALVVSSGSTVKNTGVVKVDCSGPNRKYYDLVAPLFATKEQALFDLKRMDRSPYMARLKAAKESSVMPLIPKSYSDTLLRMISSAGTRGKGDKQTGGEQLTGASVVNCYTSITVCSVEEVARSQLGYPATHPLQYRYVENTSECESNVTHTGGGTSNVSTSDSVTLVPLGVSAVDVDMKTAAADALDRQQQQLLVSGLLKYPLPFTSNLQGVRLPTQQFQRNLEAFNQFKIKYGTAGPELNTYDTIDVAMNTLGPGGINGGAPKPVYNIDTTPSCDRAKLEPSWLWEPFTEIEEAQRFLDFLHWYNDTVLVLHMNEAREVLDRYETSYRLYRETEVEQYSLAYEDHRMRYVCWLMCLWFVLGTFTHFFFSDTRWLCIVS